jgi:F-type H+-transporting ATPase subunit alpha
MKKIAGTLKLDQAQYRELEAFSKFGSDLDPATLAILDKGAKNVEILKQGQYQPLPIEKQIAIIFCGTKGLLSGIKIEKIKDFQNEFLDFLNLKHRDILDSLRSGKINEETEQTLTSVAGDIAENYK